MVMRWMMYKELAYLTEKVKTGEQTIFGDDIYDYIKTAVFVNVKSVTRNEFYTAHVAGFDPEIVFEIADYFDYDGQQFIEYNNVIYKVIRTYRTNISLQIVCQHIEDNG